jgi:hypothetical protein
MSATKQDLEESEAGLLKSIKDLSGRMSTLASTKGALTADASTLLGLDFQAKQYGNRREALLDPSRYASKRSAAFDDMKANINNKHVDALKHYIDAGMPPEMAKKFALQAAANESSIQQQVFELSFPSGANILEMAAAAPRLVSLGGAQNTAVKRRAPAGKRGAPARRR